MVVKGKLGTVKKDFTRLPATVKVEGNKITMKLLRQAQAGPCSDKYSSQHNPEHDKRRGKRVHLQAKDHIRTLSHLSES